MRTTFLTKALGTAVVLAACSALAGPDTFFVGNGQDSAKTVSSNGIINNYAQVLEDLEPGEPDVTTGLATDTGSGVPNFAGSGPSDPGDLVLIIQTTGIAPVATSGNQATIDLNGNAVGRWELARLASVDTSVPNQLTLQLTRPLKYAYAANKTQVVRVPEYTTVLVAENTRLRARAWDNANQTGGVVAFLAQGAVTLDNGSSISANGAGFRGGVYARDTALTGGNPGNPYTNCPVSTQLASTQAKVGEGVDSSKVDSARGVGNVANGGGGGICVQAGGGGGGNAGVGGIGGKSNSGTDGGRTEASGLGGAALSFSPIDHLLLGGGGGAPHGYAQSSPPHGGAGGGIVFIRAASISIAPNESAVITASGDTGEDSNNDGAGGGGAGGTLYVRLTGAGPCGGNPNFLVASGGAGGDSTNGNGVLRGPGGGGGGGRVLFQATTAAACLPNVSSGIAGLAATGEHHGALPSASGFPYSGTATVLASALTSPAAPTLDATGATSNNPLQTLLGSGVANTEVVIYASDAQGQPTGSEFGRAAVGLPTESQRFSVTLSRPLPQGTTALVAVTESQGLQSGPSNSISFTIDTVVPDTSFATNGVPVSPSNSSSTTFTFTSNEGGVSYQCVRETGAQSTAPAVGDSRWNPGCGNPYSVTGLSDNTYTMWARARDNAGNFDTTPARHEWLVDLTPPTTDFDSGGRPNANHNATTARFSFTSNDANATFQCFVVSPQSATEPLQGDSRWSAQPCPNPYFAGPLADNTNHTLWVRAKDRAGNVDTTLTGQSHSWTVDLTPPETSFTLPLPDAVNNDTEVSFTFSGDGTSFECSFDNGAFAGCTSGVTFQTPEVDYTYSLVVRAVDAAGNKDPTPATYTWKADKVEPTTGFANGGTPNANHNATTARFSFTSNDANATFQCFVVSPQSATVPLGTDSRWSAQPCPNPYFAGPLEDNTSYTLWVRAKDHAGNVDTSVPVVGQSHSWTVDLSPPETSFTLPLPDAVNNDTQVSFTFSSVGGTSFECSFDNEAFEVCSSGVTFQTPEVDYTYSLVVRAVDAAGNKDPTPATYAWKADKLEPDTQMTALVGALTNQARAGFEFDSGAPDVAGFECVVVTPQTATPPAVDSPAWDDCAASYLTSARGDGSTNTLWVRAKDHAGNVDTSVPVAGQSHSWTVDLTPPTTKIEDGPELLTGDQTAEFDFSSDSAAFYECSLNDGEYAQCNDPHTISGLGERVHKLLVRAVDAAENRDPTPDNYVWEVTLDEVETTLKARPPELTRDTSASFEFGATLSNVTFVCKLDMDPPYDCATSEDPEEELTGLQQGNHTLEVYAVETASGKADPTPLVIEWEIDRTPPNPPAVSFPAMDGAYVTTRRPEFQGTTDEDGTLSISIDGRNVGTVENVVEGALWRFSRTVDFPDGEYTLSVSLTDKANNTGASRSRTFIVDDTDPETTLARTPLDLTSFQAFEFEVTSNEANTSFECSLDGAGFAPCNARYEDTVADGRHTLEVRAVDQAGNRDESPASFTWRVDSLEPTTTIAASPPLDTNVIQASFRFESDEESVRFECSFDGTPFEPCTAALARDVTEGAHTLEVRARDLAGNADSTPATFAWRLDTLDPEAPVVSAPAAGTVLGTRRPTFQGTAEPGVEVIVYIDGLDVGTARVEPSGQWRLTLGADTSEGEHVVTASTRDAAGNDGPVSSETAFKVDLSINIVREASALGGGLSCSTGGTGTGSLVLLGWVGLALLAARRRRS